MAERVYRVGCDCGWKGPVRTEAEKNQLTYDASWHATEIKDPRFHKIRRIIGSTHWEAL